MLFSMYYVDQKFFLRQAHVNIVKILYFLRDFQKINCNSLGKFIKALEVTFMKLGVFSTLFCFPYRFYPYSLTQRWHAAKQTQIQAATWVKLVPCLQAFKHFLSQALVGELLHCGMNGGLENGLGSEQPSVSSLQF
jgi:hypothetical protein